jgi:hypothetical protein
MIAPATIGATRVRAFALTQEWGSDRLRAAWERLLRASDDRLALFQSPEWFDHLSATETAVHRPSDQSSPDHQAEGQGLRGIPGDAPEGEGVDAPRLSAGGGSWHIGRKNLAVRAPSRW